MTSLVSDLNNIIIIVLRWSMVAVAASGVCSLFIAMESNCALLYFKRELLMGGQTERKTLLTFLSFTICERLMFLWVDLLVPSRIMMPVRRDNCARTCISHSIKILLSLSSGEHCYAYQYSGLRVFSAHLYTLIKTTGSYFEFIISIA